MYRLELYDLDLDVEVITSSKGLALWHGGVTELQEDRVRIQLHPKMDPKEVLNHELAHAGRAHLNELRFEEFFAYRLSKFGYRRWLGPVIRRRWEPYLLILTSLLAGWTFLPMTALITLGLVRLGWNHYLLRRCLRRLSKFTTRPWAVAYRLRDKEIAKADLAFLKEVAERYHASRTSNPLVTDGLAQGGQA